MTYYFIVYESLWYVLPFHFHSSFIRREVNFYSHFTEKNKLKIGEIKWLSNAILSKYFKYLYIGISPNQMDKRWVEQTLEIWVNVLKLRLQVSYKSYSHYLQIFYIFFNIPTCDLDSINFYF